ncbi:calmodulin-binding transcription activator 5-like isoform X2 [Arachis stenosperma]|uniref:calmodulin-binding transcription activator 5-like isoform X2 n=1 Tax=Arachis stenosperma TaxID=217475 RepID=UPI0025AB62E1|nr:calmodulin-binding transcription activator 5-like isoform X2 [Arachis stenosperma]
MCYMLYPMIWLMNIINILSQSQGSPVTLVNSHSSSASDQPCLSEELDSGTNTAYASGFNDNLMVVSHEMKLHELNTLEWDDLVLSNDNTSIAASGNVQSFNQQKPKFSERELWQCVRHHCT